jgi:ankyrin repeat protein
MLKVKKLPWLLLFWLLLPPLVQAVDLNGELINAVRAGKLVEVRDLIAQGADINTKNTAGKSVLMMAANLGNSRIVDILLAEGADVNAKDNQESTALIAAAYQGDLHIVKALVAQGADLSAASKNGVTALSTAKLVGYDNVVKFLEDAEKAKGGGSGTTDKSKGRSEFRSRHGK